MMESEVNDILSSIGGSSPYPPEGVVGPSLCAPDQLRTCFACCPPIRPAGYAHVDHRAAVARMLRENTASFRTMGDGVLPILGFSCWALGYLGSGYRLIGCLLHPAQNRGVDLRHRVDFGDKCRRETCPEAKVFDALTPDAKRTWICLADGLDAFTYSSRKHNPLFNMMGWGRKVLEWVARNGHCFSRDDFFEVYPFFRTTLNPCGHAYLLSRILLSTQGGGITSSEYFRDRFERFSGDLVRVLGEIPAHRGQAAYTHRLPLDRSFLDFLRLSCGFKRVTLTAAVGMKAKVDRELEGFTQVLLRRGMS
jgi:hypothetical protein